MKKITSIGIEIPSNGDNYIKLDSKRSLSESDIVIFSPDFGHSNYSTYDNFNSSQTYEGKMLYTKNSSAKIIEHSKHWKNEILHFAENGGTVFFILTKREDFYIYTGKKDFSGTGRNQKTTDLVTPFSNYNFSTIQTIEFTSASGSFVNPCNNLFIDFHKSFQDYLSYDIYLKGEELQDPIFTTKNKDRILGTMMKIKKGHIIFLPNINFDKKGLVKYNTKNNQSSWTPEAIRIGKSLLGNIAEIDKTLKKSMEKTPKPNWLQSDEFNLKNSLETENLIKKNEITINKKIQENEKLNLLLEEQESLKDLLFESGKLLENAVIKALTILGYKAENYDDGELELDQIILSPEGERFIGECEGKDTKDIDVTKFRQLLDGLNADFEKENVKEKAYGLLFGNAQRLIAPNERKLSFTAKCLTGAKREKIGLIKTEDLFRICRIIQENNDSEYAAQCRKAIFEQLGEIIIFPNK
ncbi:hypothetical protein [Chryseobacterium sp. SG20098]|uniref:hypothetical protein n=1 Tax=Chryseobacterium sp. SG20098 TaxID=3074145 RepID=UPI00288347EE|nr:hypothetical protein [Chryseobacterium sp. SG20098]WNI38177.1 hypothetical protein RHP76_06760 [Chryseobacterium sp. SG20098]